MKAKIYSMLKDYSFNPKVIFDCGAALGEWSSVIRGIWPDSTIVGIDANDWNKGQSIPGANIKEITVLYSEAGKEITFYKNKSSINQGTCCTGDSIFKENTIHYKDENLIEEKRITSTLNTILEKYKLDKIDLIKLDTQGSEIEILKGLGDKIKYVSFIELEVSVFEFNEGGCSFTEVVNYLSKHFELFDIFDMKRNSTNTLSSNKDQLPGDFLFQMDLLFRNKNFKLKK